MNGQTKKVLVVGGTSGLGLQMALKFSGLGNHVFITGRKNPDRENLNFVDLDITDDNRRLASDLSWITDYIGEIDLFVYAAGFYENGTIGELSDEGIAKQTNISLNAPAMLLRRILRKQSGLSGFIAITSTTQWIPRLKEPMYKAGKNGLAGLAESIALDPQVGKVLVIGPAGMNTDFWGDTGRHDAQNLLDPAWVAGQILELYYRPPFDYLLARILRDPPRVEVLEVRVSN